VQNIQLRSTTATKSDGVLVWQNASTFLFPITRNTDSRCRNSCSASARREFGPGWIMSSFDRAHDGYGAGNALAECPSCIVVVSPSGISPSVRGGRGCAPAEDKKAKNGFACSRAPSRCHGSAHLGFLHQYQTVSFTQLLNDDQFLELRAEILWRQTTLILQAVVHTAA
jgi:hypothetical protein